MQSALIEISKHKARYDGSGDGQSFDANDAKLLYSKGDLHILSVNL